MELTVQPLLSKEHLEDAKCVPGMMPAPAGCGPAQQERPGGWLRLTPLRGKIGVYITPSILYLFWILSSDIKAADINLQGQKLALMDPIKSYY